MTDSEGITLVPTQALRDAVGWYFDRPGVSLQRYDDAMERMAECLPPEYTDELAEAFYRLATGGPLFTRDLEERYGQAMLGRLHAAGWKVTPPSQDGEE